ncbi:hypothetical protein TNCT_409021 [Trichonephila clavata]|uniref:Uncharacterized protein n=1 Tax=Trichonephila clavata TaxID=2740835 RepID=A0A8X6JNZ4_TRICU|nr:hypothetical protein TNCT_409021 [Trichonephila clavata]
MIIRDFCNSIYHEGRHSIWTSISSTEMVDLEKPSQPSLTLSRATNFANQIHQTSLEQLIDFIDSPYRYKIAASVSLYGTMLILLFLYQGFKKKRFLFTDNKISS